MITSVQGISGLMSAIAKAAPGDVVQLRDGVYVLPDILRTPVPGTNAAPITIRAEHQGQAIIESNSHEEAIRLTQPYWALDGLTVRATKGSTYCVKLEGPAHHCAIRNSILSIGPDSEAAIKGAGAADPKMCPDSAIIESNLIMMPVPTNYDLAEGIDAVAVANWIVRKNRVRDIKTAGGTVAFGIMIKGGAINPLIEDNIVTNCFINISLGGGGTGAEWMRNGDQFAETRVGMVRGNKLSQSVDVGMYLYKASGCKIHDNFVFQSCMKQGEGGASIDCRMPATTADIMGNVLDKKINDRDGGTHADRFNKWLPPMLIGATVFTAK